MIEYKETKEIPLEELEKLYLDVGFQTYLQDLPKVLRGFQNSQDVISAWSDKQLVGLIRSVGDQETVLYVQELVVLKSFHGQGIGSSLLNKLVEKYPFIRSKVLVPEHSGSVDEFYSKLGWRWEERALMYGEREGS